MKGCRGMELPDFLQQAIDLAEAKQKNFGQASQPHQVLVGPPGCGKTAIAEAYGHALHQRGLAAAPPVVLQADMFRSIGQGAQAVAQVPDGGVIVVDEADKLAGTNMSGRDTVSALLQAMENRKCTVILTGYARQMADMLESAPDLKRRLPSVIEITPNRSKPTPQAAGWDTDTALKKSVKPLPRIKIIPR